MVLICGLENMVIVVTPSPCRLDCTPLFRRHQCLSVYIHCTGEGECLSNAWEEQALNPSSPGCWVGACSSPVDSYHLLSAVPSISSFYLSTSSLEDSCYWWWRWGKVSWPSTSALIVLGAGGETSLISLQHANQRERPLLRTPHPPNSPPPLPDCMRQGLE